MEPWLLGMVVGEEDEAAGRVREGLARQRCRGFPLVCYTILSWSNPQFRLNWCIYFCLSVGSYHKPCVLLAYSCTNVEQWCGEERTVLARWRHSGHQQCNSSAHSCSLLLPHSLFFKRSIVNELNFTYTSSLRTPFYFLETTVCFFNPKGV